MKGSDTTRGSNRGTILLIGVLAIPAVLLAWYMLSKPTAIDRSVLGLRGFAHVARQDDGIKIRFFDGSGTLSEKQIGLRILPLYDPNIFQYVDEKNEDSNKNEVMRAMSEHVFASKISSLPTLVILPKWREGVVILEKLHPELLISLKSMRLPYKKSDVFGGPDIRRGEIKFAEKQFKNMAPDLLPVSPQAMPVSLYAAQTVRLGTVGAITKRGCKPILTDGADVLLARCSFDLSRRNQGFWLLTDPDIFNNHGAGNGENYKFALALVKALSGEKQIMVDGTSRVFITTEKQVREPARSLSDLARFFVYPFSLFWAVLAGLAFFTLWHAWLRAGPVIDREKSDAMKASKATAIEANVAILRGSGKRSGNDIPLARAYASQRMEALGAELFGSNRKLGESGDVQIFTALGRRNAGLTKRFSSARKRLGANAPVLKTSTGLRALFTTLNEFENHLEEARHEFGRPANPRR